MINGFFIWDKVSSINGNKASVVLDSDKSFKDGTVVFFTNNGRPTVHALVENLRVELNMLDQTDEEVCQLKLNKLIEEFKSEQQEQITLEEQANKISILEGEQETQNEEILSNMLATTEVFEMILTMSAPMSVDIENKNKNKNLGGSSMVEVYVTLILKGVKTIDQVPAIIRDQVQTQLDLLTK
ncbi:CD1375 family protein [Romboutsia sp. 1001713B170131_170501_G6]|uniref:CD1375 family protein n=1 Tax=Romboutsia sp. 1001713B170131_170501_G6 TaxID=2787108 RepID=UPI0018A987A1|nr:CD1375 family protein [Romboutsia sp. 1001713B170131_170501_G6]